MRGLSPTFRERLGIAGRILKRPLLWNREGMKTALKEARSPAEVRAILFRCLMPRRTAHLYACWDYQGEWDAALVYEVTSESTADLAGLARNPGVRGEAALAWLDLALTQEKVGGRRGKCPLEEEEYMRKGLALMLQEGRLSRQTAEIQQMRQQFLREPWKSWRREVVLAFPDLTVEELRQALSSLPGIAVEQREILKRWLEIAPGEAKREPWERLCAHSTPMALEVFESFAAEEKAWMKASDLLPLLQNSSADIRMRALRAGLPVMPVVAEVAPAASLSPALTESMPAVPAGSPLTEEVAPERGPAVPARKRAR